MADPPNGTPADTNSSERSPLFKDFLASVVVFLVALPLCMGIAIASGVPVAYGLITGIVGGLVVGCLAGSPLQVSGPAAGLAVVNYELVKEGGLEILGITVLIAGVLQVVAGVCKLGQWFRAVSPSVIEGMLAGIGVLIFASQFHVMVDDDPKDSGLNNLLTIPQAIMKGLPFPSNIPIEQRKFLTDHVRQVGSLHEAQVELREDVGFRLISEGTAAAKAEDLMAEQDRISGEVDRIIVEMGEAGVVSGDREEERRSAIQDVQEALTAAHASFESGENLAVTQEQADSAILGLEKSMKNHDWAAKVGLLTIVVIFLWRLVPEKVRAVPAPLVAIVVSTAFAYFLTLPVLYTEVPDNLFSAIQPPTMPLMLNLEWGFVLKSAVVVAIVASAETLLCATAVDQMHTGPRTKYNKELFAQGVGNTVCGLAGSLPMTGVIVRSAANVQAGGQTRLSAILHGAWLLALVAFFPQILKLIPTSALAAILVYTGIRLMNFGKLKHLWNVGKGEALIFLATVAMIVCTDLLSGVITGIVLAGAKLLTKFSKLDACVVEEDEKHVLHIRGTATFVSLPRLAEGLEAIPAGDEVTVDPSELRYIDHSCLELLRNWQKQHEATGGKVDVDWETLEKIGAAVA